MTEAEQSARDAARLTFHIDGSEESLDKVAFDCGWNAARDFYQGQIQIAVQAEQKAIAGELLAFYKDAPGLNKTSSLGVRIRHYVEELNDED